MNRYIELLVCIALPVTLFTACNSADDDNAIVDDVGSASAIAARPQIVQVTAMDYRFEAPAEIPSGWTTFRMDNVGGEHHFLLVHRLPEGKTFDDYVQEAAPPFDSVMTARRAGMDKAEAGALLGQLLPEWFASVKQMGGVGLVAPGRTGEATVQLEPGNYLIECYVKTPDGRFHSALGMAQPLTVTATTSVGAAPAADLAMTLSNYEIATEGEITAGEHTIAVNFAEHPEFGLGNDVHVVRLNEGTELANVVEWMDWLNVGGLRSPAPAEFIGGTQEMPAGSTAYFTVELEPGRYAWIAESTAAQGMVKEFTVPPGR